MSKFHVTVELEIDAESWAVAVCDMKAIQGTIEDVYNVPVRWAPGDVVEQEEYVRPPYPTEGGLATDWPDDIDGDLDG